MVRWGRANACCRRKARLPERALRPAGAGALTQEPVEAGGAEAVLAAGPLEAVVAQTRPVGVVALGPVLAVALVGALRPVGAHGALVLAPAPKRAEEDARGHRMLTATNAQFKVAPTKTGIQPHFICGGKKN